MTAPTPYNNHSLVGEALRLLSAGLGPYVTDKMREAVEAAGTRLTTPKRWARLPVISR